MKILIRRALFAGLLAGTVAGFGASSYAVMIGPTGFAGDMVRVRASLITGVTPFPSGQSTVEVQPNCSVHPTRPPCVEFSRLNGNGNIRGSVDVTHDGIIVTYVQEHLAGGGIPQLVFEVSFDRSLVEGMTFAGGSRPDPVDWRIIDPHTFTFTLPTIRFPPFPGDPQVATTGTPGTQGLPATYWAFVVSAPAPATILLLGGGLALLRVLTRRSPRSTP